VEALQNHLRPQLEEIKRQGLFREVRYLEGAQGSLVRMGGKEVIMLGANNYLGLASHPEVKKASMEAIEKFGAGAASVREVCGTTSLIRTLEERLAGFYKMEKCLVFTSCSTANLGMISTLMGDGSIIFSDEENHASIIDGCQAAKGNTIVYPHNNTDYVNEEIKKFKDAHLKMIVTDGVFSMSGDIAAVPRLLEIANSNSAILVVDEAHAAGVLGETGRGTPENYDLEGKIHIITGTLGKSFGGGAGGFVVGSKDLIDFLFHRSRSFIFTNAIPPAVAASALKAIEIIKEHPELILKLRRNTVQIRNALNEIGYEVSESQTPIIPILTQDTHRTTALSRRLFEEGIFAPSIGYPVVPEGQARIRVQVSAALSQSIIQRAITIFEKVGRELHLI
jgi:glycine C-acetyltransferase